MKTLKLLTAALLGAGLTLGCGKPPEPTKADAKKKDDADDHDHGPGPHDGTVIELGKWHGEFCVDHGKKQATVYILDGKVQKAVPVAAQKLLLSIKSPSFQVDLLPSPQEGDPAGKASRFVATHDKFGKEQEFEGTVSLEIDGKPYAGDFKEEKHDHDHGKKK
jgi:hypothetical protein